MISGTTPDDQAFRQPPHNLALEQALLGAVLINNEALERVSGLLSAEHFFDPLHQRIFDAAVSFVASGKVANPITMRPAFANAPEISPGVSVAQYLGTLVGNATTIINARHYAQEIVNLSTLRALIIIGEDVVNTAYDTASMAEPQALIEDAESKLFAIAERDRNIRDEIAFHEASLSAVRSVCDAYKRGGKLSGISTGFRDLDFMTGGLHKSDLIILAGRPSMGKTALATNIAWNVARQGLAVDFRSMEMSADQLALRILASETRLCGEKLRRGDCSELQLREVIDAQRRIANTRLITDDSGGLSIAQLSARCRRAKRKHGTELIVIDYLQLMSGSKRTRDGRVQEVTEITTGLKALAKELQVPIIALSQLNRSVEARDNKRPSMPDLRESGSIEQDADVVLFVYRDEYYVQRAKPSDHDVEAVLKWQQELAACAGKAEVIIGKQRHGSLGTVDMAFEGAFTRFSDLAREYADAR